MQCNSRMLLFVILDLKYLDYDSELGRRNARGYN